jgi:hypothetical protein
MKIVFTGRSLLGGAVRIHDSTRAAARPHKEMPLAGAGGGCGRRIRPAAAKMGKRGNRG